MMKSCYEFSEVSIVIFFTFDFVDKFVRKQVMAKICKIKSVPTMKKILKEIVS